MAIIDARTRFEARREAARRQNGQFGEQTHTEPEMSLEQVFEEMNELGELVGETVDRYVDTLTGTPHQQESEERKRQYFDMLRRAGIDPDTVPEAVASEIHGRLEDRQRERKAAEEFRRKHPKTDDTYSLPAPLNETDKHINVAVETIIEARGYTVAEYGRENTEYLLEWAREHHAAGTLQDAFIMEARRSKTEREERERADREGQLMLLGPLTDAVWDEALAEDRLRAQQEFRKLRKTKYVPLKETNALIRRDLGAAFPGVKFAVRGHSYSGGASTDVNYVDGPPKADVEEAAKVFEGSKSDWTGDFRDPVHSAEFDEHGVPITVSYAPDHVFVNRTFSEETEQEATTRALKAFRDAGVEFHPERKFDYHTELPQPLLANDTIRSMFWRGNSVSNNEIILALSTQVADEKWAARASN